MIPAKIEGDVPPGAIGLIASVPRLAERYHLQGAAALVKVAEGETVPFRLINPTSKPITLYKGASLGTFSEVILTFAQSGIAVLCSLHDWSQAKCQLT